MERLFYIFNSTVVDWTCCNFFCKGITIPASTLYWDRNITCWLYHCWSLYLFLGDCFRVIVKQQWRGMFSKFLWFSPAIPLSTIVPYSYNCPPYNVLAVTRHLGLYLWMGTDGQRAVNCKSVWGGTESRLLLSQNHYALHYYVSTYLTKNAHTRTHVRFAQKLHASFSCHATYKCLPKMFISYYGHKNLMHFTCGEITVFLRSLHPCLKS